MKLALQNIQGDSNLIGQTCACEIFWHWKGCTTSTQIIKGAITILYGWKRATWNEDKSLGT